MNNQASSLSPEALRLVVSAIIVSSTTVIALVGAVDALLAAAGISAVVLFFAGWKLEGIRTALRSLARCVVGNPAHA